MHMLDKFRNFVAGAAGSLALALSGGVAAQEPVSAVEQARATTGPALWQVKDDDTSIYLFGTVHALPPGMDWYDARIQSAFDASDEFVTEIDMADGAAMAQTIASQAMLPAGTTLRSLMTEENRIEYEKVLTDMNLPVSALDPMEPWFAAMNLSLLPLLNDGYSADSGVETSLTSRAQGKTRGALETIEQQIALFDTLPMEAQLTFLDGTVESVPRAASTLNAMVAEWAEGDADQLAVLMNAELDDPELYKRLMTDRNANWADWITARLEQPGKVFIAVGAGHLAGEHSVQQQLAKRGIEVTRIYE